MALKCKCIEIATIISVLVILNIISITNKNPIFKQNTHLDFASATIRPYNEEFKQYSKIKASYKTKQDHLNRHLKIIKPNTRQIFGTEQKTYVVLEYTKVFGQTKFCRTSLASKQKERMTAFSACSYQNCLFTCNRKYIANADAVLFHEYDLAHKLDDDERYMRQALLHRNHSQIWILWHDEPSYIHKYIDKYRFNWTMSYRYDAEISHCAYGCKYSINIESDFDFIDKMRIQFSRRKNESLWMVSNCLSQYRMEFTWKIMDHYPVAIIGLCEDLIKSAKLISVSIGSMTYKFMYYAYYAYKQILIWIGLINAGSNCERHTNCELQLMSEYKFYMAFESRNTSYYITEKFWRVLEQGLIPVVIQPKKVFYENIAPPNSFIHAEDFDYDPERLAKHLQSISNDFNLYLKYVEWKLNYKTIHANMQTEPRRLCELCTRLNLETSSVYYKSVSEWFNKD